MLEEIRGGRSKMMRCEKSGGSSRIALNPRAVKTAPPVYLFRQSRGTYNKRAYKLRLPIFD